MLDTYKCAFILRHTSTVLLERVTRVSFHD
jgi:hypothetical protein